MVPAHKKCFAKDYECRTPQLAGHGTAKDSDNLPEHIEWKWDIDFWKFNRKAGRGGFVARECRKKHFRRRFDNFEKAVEKRAAVNLARVDRQLRLHRLNALHSAGLVGNEAAMLYGPIAAVGRGHCGCRLQKLSADQRHKQSRVA